jgi:2-polyprenyl-3-methyl-5-hydroxy-6-metoxy-1,4-benzoquinol methylase
MKTDSSHSGCEICKSDDWFSVYEGPIRDGAYGGLIEDAIILECNTCRVQRLKEEYCIPPSFYESGEYRKKLDQSLKSEKALIEQDQVQKFMIQSIGGIENIRNKIVADVGCGIGSLLSVLSNAAKESLGVEPCEPYAKSLIAKGYNIFPDIISAIANYGDGVDLVLSSQVIEHVENPKLFLNEIYQLLNNNGMLIISTPNRNDILNFLLPEFNSFFYRTQHRWYFDEESILNCIKLTDFKVKKVEYIHRYGMANAIEWLRIKKPTGSNRIKQISSLADNLWSAYLNNSGMSDNLFIHLEK